MQENIVGKRQQKKLYKSMKVALVYDRVNKWGGAERILLALHELFPKAPLYTSVYNKKSAIWAQIFTIYTSFLQKIPFAPSYHEWFAWLVPIAFETFNFDKYDLVISVTSADAKGIITKPRTVHLCYCLTPTRYLWSQYLFYFRNIVLRFVSYPVVKYLQRWDMAASSRPDKYIAISKTVQERIKRYYKRDSYVIYPALFITKKSFPIYSHMSARKRYSKDRKSYRFFLVVSRLVPYKRVDLVIKACSKLKLPLVIIGVGSDEYKLKKIANENVRFVKNLTDRDLAWYYQHSIAVIMAQDEDYGLVSIEAQSYGTPVIAYRKGGVQETVIEGKTGLYFEKQSVDSLIKALLKFDPSDYNVNDCIENAKRFSKAKFKKEIMKVISEISN